MILQIRGREARDATAHHNLTKTALQTVLFWTTFLLLIPLVILQLDRWSNLDRWWFDCTNAQACGAVLFMLGGTLGLSSGYVMARFGRGTPWPFDCPNALVVIGPYAYVRNPMVVAGLSQGVAVGLMFGSLSIVAYSLLGAPVWHLLVRPREESDLAERFGGAYETYRYNVRCWLPRWSPYRRI